MQEVRHCKDMKLKEKGRYSTVRDIHQGIAIGILNMMIQEWNKSPGKQEQRKKEKQEYGGRRVIQWFSGQRWGSGAENICYSYPLSGSNLSPQDARLGYAISRQNVRLGNAISRQYVCSTWECNKSIICTVCSTCVCNKSTKSSTWECNKSTMCSLGYAINRQCVLLGMQ